MHVILLRGEGARAFSAGSAFALQLVGYGRSGDAVLLSSDNINTQGAGRIGLIGIPGGG